MSVCCVYIDDCVGVRVGVVRVGVGVCISVCMWVGVHVCVLCGY